MVVDYVKHDPRDRETAKRKAKVITRVGWSIWIIILALLVLTLINFFAGFLVVTPSGGQSQATNGNTQVSYAGVWRVDTPNGSGSCFLISTSGDTGVFITAKHVIGDATQISVTDQQGDVYAANIIGESSDADVAVISAGGSFDQSWVMKLGQSASLRMQDNIVVAGWPEGLFSVTEGSVSGIYTDHDPPYIMTTAAINPGNSGGPAVRSNDGTVVGMVVSTIKGTEGMHFFLPIDYVMKAVHKACPGLSFGE